MKQEIKLSEIFKREAIKASVQTQLSIDGQAAFQESTVWALDNITPKVAIDFLEFMEGGPTMYLVNRGDVPIKELFNEFITQYKPEL